MDVHPPKNCIFIGIDPYPYLPITLRRGDLSRCYGLPHRVRAAQRRNGSSSLVVSPGNGNSAGSGGNKLILCTYTYIYIYILYIYIYTHIHKYDSIYIYNSLFVILYIYIYIIPYIYIYNYGHHLIQKYSLVFIRIYFRSMCGVTRNPCWRPQARCLGWFACAAAEQAAERRWAPWDPPVSFIQKSGMP